MRTDTTHVDSRAEAVSTSGHDSGKGAPAAPGRDDAGAPVKPPTVLMPMAVYAEHHRGQDGTAIVCPVCVEKVWYANTAYGYMKLTDYIEAHREHTRPPRLELPETAVTVRQGEPVGWPS